MTETALRALTDAQVAFAYHARTKHSLEKYAAGPETLDWDSQPNPFREFAGCPRISLELSEDHPATTLAQIYNPADVPCKPLTLGSVATLLELSMGLSAWKEYGPDRWAVRCNPSSGNLHPTEAYLFSSNIQGLEDGLYHYVSRDHALEQRNPRILKTRSPSKLWIGLSSIYWREAWKYGERAFRYCQLDIGHALGAFRYAAGTLGWKATLVDIGSDKLTRLMGLDRLEDFRAAELEEADLLLSIEPLQRTTTTAEKNDAPADDTETAAAHWTGVANLLDPHPIYRWPVIDQVSSATHGKASVTPPTPLLYPPISVAPAARASSLILNRRSAQRFDPKFRMSADVFHRLLDSLLARPCAPWDIWNFEPRVHPIFLVHRVEGLEPGLYALPRNRNAEQLLRMRLRPDFEWRSLHNTPAGLPFFRLLPADCRMIAKKVSCHQAIASDSCFSLSMLSEFEPIIEPNSWRYRQLHWEAGLLGHVLYLEAEAAGLRGTGIGCYFDDAMHGMLGIDGTQLQSLYHFTVGRHIADTRITTSPPYPNLRAASIKA